MSRSGRVGPARAALLAAGLILAGAAATLAQGGAAGRERVQPPVPHKADASPPTLWNYFVMVVLVGAVFIANLIPSKRGHQD